MKTVIKQRQHLKSPFRSKLISWLMLCVVLFSDQTVIAQSRSKSTGALKQGSFYSGIYPNLFKEAGYSQADIDAKIAKTYYDLFEGPKRVCF